MGTLAKLASPRNLTIIILMAVGLGIGIAIGSAPDSKKPGSNTEQTIQNAATVKTSPPAVSVSVLDGAAPGSSANYLLPLGKDLAHYLSENDSGSSVYLEDLTSHLALHVGETKAYDIKSLMKVPLVMSLYKAVETGRLKLDDTITLTPSEIDSSFGDLWKKKAGYQLTLGEAAKIALQQSDNTAIHAINDHVYPIMPQAERAYRAVNLDLYIDDKGDSYTSTAGYATIFRCLYTACYNTREDSDALLDLLKHSDFNAPSQHLPADTVVAHKIGSATTKGNNDCGIVYGPKAPFIFCIMLTASQPQADQDVGQIVKHAYDFLEKR